MSSLRFQPAWLLLVLVSLFGCGSGNKGVTITSSAPSTESSDATISSEAANSETTDANKQQVIGFSALNLGNPFFVIIADTLKAEAAPHGYEVTVDDAAGDVKKQAEHIDAYIARKVSAIVLNPTDRESIGPAIQKANQAGIPVFTCDLECVAPEAIVVGHVGTDNYGGGKLAGEAMIEALGEAGGKVFILHFKQANSCVDRVNGFREVIEAYNKNRETGRIDIVGEDDGGGAEDKGFAATSTAIQANPDLNGLFAINDPSGLGAYAALEQAGKAAQVKIVAFDGQLVGKQAIQEGKIYADPIQFPDQMAKLTMQNIVSYFRGDPFEPVTLIPTKLYRKADAENDPELK